MGKKMKLPFLSKHATQSQAKSSSWPWPSCHQPRTLSFRTNNEAMFKTINSAYLDTTTNIIEAAETPESWFTNSSDSVSSTASDDESGAGGATGVVAVVDPVETVIRGLRSETERLFFKPGQTSSILEEAKPENYDVALKHKHAQLPFKESVVLSMESQDPYMDFRKSMEEMVEAQGLKDWEGLEELLCWYLRANGKSNHGYIFGAFVDLLVGLSLASSSSTSATSCSCSRSPSSPLSFYTSSSSSSDDSSSTPCVSSSLEADPQEIDNKTQSSLSSLLEAETDEIRNDDDDSNASSLLDAA